MRSLVISCTTNQPEIDMVNMMTNCNYPVIYLDSKLHDKPELLKLALQKELDSLTNIDQVLLAMGYCGNSIVGIKSSDFRIVIPRVDDCLTLFLGSQKKRQEIMNEAATYFFTKGWLDSDRNISAEYKALLKKYGKEKTEIVFEAMFEHYKRLGLIDTGLFELEPQIYKIDKIAKLLKIDFEIISGTKKLIVKLFSGPYDNDFVIIDHFSIVKSEDLKLDV